MIPRANESGAGASSYQTNPNPARYSEVRTDRATLEKLSIVRILRNAPDLSIRYLSGDGVGCLSRWLTGSACAGSGENLSRNPRGRAEACSKNKFKRRFPARVNRRFEGRLADGLLENCAGIGAPFEAAPGSPRHGAQGAVHVGQTASPCAGGGGRRFRLRSRLQNRIRGGTGGCAQATGRRQREREVDGAGFRRCRGGRELLSDARAFSGRARCRRGSLPTRCGAYSRAVTEETRGGGETTRSCSFFPASGCALAPWWRCRFRWCWRSSS